MARAPTVGTCSHTLPGTGGGSVLLQIDAVQVRRAHTDGAAADDQSEGGSTGGYDEACWQCSAQVSRFAAPPPPAHLGQARRCFEVTVAGALGRLRMQLMHATSRP